MNRIEHMEDYTNAVIANPSLNIAREDLIFPVRMATA